tara:strand:+ start:79 stop:777 length:699 start_codon:yes stop_codon:yes gene_type:complete
MSFILPNHEIKAGTEFNDSKYDISHQMLFQTPLFEIHIDDIDNRQLEKNIYKLRDETEDGLDKSNRGGGWHSLEQSLHPEQYCGVQSKDEEKYKLHPMDDSFKSLTDKLIDILHNLPFEPKIDRIDNMSIWAMINEKGSYNTLHNHPGCDIAGVYYVKVPEGDCGNIAFSDPRESYVFGNGFMVTRYSGGEIIPRFPVEGNMYLFPACLHHEVGMNITDEDRISISFNLILS